MNDAMPQGDVNPRQFPSRLHARQTVRKAENSDILFMIELGKEAYPGRGIENGVPWICWCISNPERLVLVGEHSMGVAQLSWQYGYERRARMEMLASRRSPKATLEALQMIRQMVQWAKLRGAKGDFTLDSDTGVDFGPFSQRLGGRQQTLLQYKIPLE